MPTGSYYHGIAVFKRERDKNHWNYDWADLAQWERDKWGERQDMEMLGKTWHYETVTKTINGVTLTYQQ